MLTRRQTLKGTTAAMMAASVPATAQATVPTSVKALDDALLALVDENRRLMNVFNEADKRLDRIEAAARKAAPKAFNTWTFFVLREHQTLSPTPEQIASCFEHFPGTNPQQRVMAELMQDHFAAHGARQRQVLEALEWLPTFMEMERAADEQLDLLARILESPAGPRGMVAKFEVVLAKDELAELRRTRWCTHRMLDNNLYASVLHDLDRLAKEA